MPNPDAAAPQVTTGPHTTWRFTTVVPTRRDTKQDADANREGLKAIPQTTSSTRIVNTPAPRRYP